MNPAVTLEKSGLKTTIHYGSVSYSEPIDVLSDEEIDETKMWFENEKKRGVIISGDYYSDAWYLTDEVLKSVKISFEIDELMYMRNSRQTLGCTFSEYQDALRVYVRSCAGFALGTIVRKMNTLRRFGETHVISGLAGDCAALYDFLWLLPCNDSTRDALLAEVETSLTSSRANDARTIALYQSAFRFDYYLERFWQEADEEERLLYFPVWFWWSISSIIPRRATECIVTPRRCVRKSKGEYFIQLRRTLKKANRGKAAYKLDQDYEICEYPIPRRIYDVVSWYIDKTEDVYDSDNDTLFCKHLQFEYANVTQDNDGHYTVQNLNQLLQRFYKLLSNRYGLYVLDSEDETPALTDKMQMQRLQLGDTRHIAIISLIISTSNIRVAQELAGHNSINTTYNYYQNANLYLRAIHMDIQIAAPQSARNRVFHLRADRDSILMNPADWVPVSGGKCCNKKYAEGCYDDCASAVDIHGNFNCRCRFFRSTAIAECSQDETNNRLAESCTMLRVALESERAEKGKKESLFTAISRIQTDALAVFDNQLVQDFYE